jgi:hypothetical protein
VLDYHFWIISKRVDPNEGFEVPRVATRISQWKICKKETSHSALLNDIPSRANNNSGDFIFFKMPDYQTHGLVTDRSKGRKN